MENLITAKEAARILRKTPRTVARWADSGKLAEAHKLPGGTGARLFRLDDVEALRDEIDAQYEQAAS